MKIQIWMFNPFDNIFITIVDRSSKGTKTPWKTISVGVLDPVMESNSSTKIGISKIWERMTFCHPKFKLALVLQFVAHCDVHGDRYGSELPIDEPLL